ncbi:hypothetical protein QVD17_35685 [Tagetes erecta]|uniref:RING-type domain-containing protein n=1 Tax=Tagetes erecta TaxID=13708 RepID=A0AAD8JQY5_TARER|nr:hypothetical protein QVD17_35685 [Tagetes erecta]
MSWFNALFYAWFLPKSLSSHITHTSFHLLLLRLHQSIPSKVSISFVDHHITSMSRDIDSDDHYHLNGSLPADIPDNLKEFLVQDDDLSYEEVILQQACVYHSYQENGTSRVVSSDDGHIHSSDSSSSEEEEEDDDDDDDESQSSSVISQEAMDEAYARSLQELGEEFDEFFIAEFNSRPNLNQEDVDPVNMGYEDIITLTEAVGVQNVGLSAAHISQLPISIYTSGMFSNNKEEMCAICQENFKFGKRVIVLPCCHVYHRKCIIKWLKLKKNCPVCQKEVVQP